MLRVIILASLIGCGGGSGTPDASMDSAVPRCATDEECDDGLWCSGDETCDVATSTCVATAPPCDTSQTCDEDAQECTSECTPDGDGDGVNAADCGGSDCDDADPNRFPGNAEICDTMHHDEDCDPVTFGYRDADMDGRPDDRCCNLDAAGEMLCGTDCDDAAGAVSPDIIEVCNERDDDCDDATDEGVRAMLYRDEDGDMFGDARTSMFGCPGLTGGWVTDATDCNDADVSVYPGATERCNGRDDDCMAPTDPLPPVCMCTDGATTLCGYSTAIATRCEPVMATCTGGVFVCPPGLITGAEMEACNGVDDNCSGVPDEGVTVSCYPDGDSDGYPPMGAVLDDVCPTVPGMCPGGHTSRSPAAGTDCNDGAATVRPGQMETCDGVDQDCDTRTDEGLHIHRYQMSWGIAATHHASCYAAGSADCAMAIHGYCSLGPTADGTCPARSGYGIAVHSSAYIEFYCTDLAPFPVPWSELEAHGFGCNGSNPHGVFCPTSAHRECRERGYEGGVGPLLDIDGAPTFLLCFTAAQAALSGTTWAALSALEPGCTGFDTRLFCQAAVSRFCEASGYAGGIGPLESAGPNVGFLCVRYF